VKEWKGNLLSSSRWISARKSSVVTGLTQIEKVIFLWVIALETDDHLDASRMMTGKILDSAGGFLLRH
jgi:hypothetical protein